MTQHLILIGFKHAGKSMLGESLSKRLSRSFIDLDDEILRHHQKECCKESSCREILNQHGEKNFRQLESWALEEALAEKTPLILALGGGTPMMEENQNLLKGHKIVHVTAPRSMIFERIMIHGKPAFFPQEEEAFDHFQKLWDQRLPVFDRLAELTVKNEGTIDSLTETVLQHLKPSI